MTYSIGILELLKKKAAANGSLVSSRIISELWLFVIFIDWIRDCWRDLHLLHDEKKNLVK